MSDFKGDWRIERQITHADGTTASFIGIARFSTIPEGLMYHETGEMQIAGMAPMTAERSYLWHPDLRVSFADGRHFHTVPPAGGSARHWCDPDQYDVDYDFADWPQWCAVWRVRGPRKDYQMISSYCRC